MACGIIVVRLAIQYLGREVYGIWALVGSLTAYGGLFQLGVASSVTRHVAAYLAARDLPTVRRWVSVAFSALLASAALMAAALVVVWIFLPTWFRAAIEPQFAWPARWALAAAGLAFVMMTPMAAVGAALTGAQGYVESAAMHVLGRLVQLAGVAIVLKAGFGLVGLAIVVGASLVIESAGKVIFAFRRIPGLRVRVQHIERDIFREMLVFGMTSFAYVLGGILQIQAAKIILGAALDAEAVTDYHLAATLVAMFGQLVVAATRAIQPASASLSTQQRQEHVQMVYRFGLKYALMFTLAALVMLELYGDAVLRIWVGVEQYDPRSAAVLRILMLGAVFRIAYASGFFVVAGLNRHRPFGVAVLGTALASIALALVLFFTTGRGILAVAWGFAIPDLLGCGLLLPRVCSRAVGVSVAAQVRGSYVPAVLGTLPLAVAAASLRMGLGYVPATLPGLLGVVGALAPFAIVGWIWLGMEHEERNRLWRYLVPAGRNR